MAPGMTSAAAVAAFIEPHRDRAATHPLVDIKVKHHRDEWRLAVLDLEDAALSAVTVSERDSATEPLASGRLPFHARNDAIDEGGALEFSEVGAARRRSARAKVQAIPAVIAPQSTTAELDTRRPSGSISSKTGFVWPRAIDTARVGRAGMIPTMMTTATIRATNPRTESPRANSRAHSAHNPIACEYEECSCGRARRTSLR